MLFRAVLVPFAAAILAGSALALPTGVQNSSGDVILKSRDTGSSGSMQGGPGPMNMSDPSSGTGNSTAFPHPGGPGPMNTTAPSSTGPDPTNSTMPSPMHHGHKNATMHSTNSTGAMNMTDLSMGAGNSTGSSGSCSGAVTVTVTAYLPGPTGGVGAMPANSSIVPTSTVTGMPLTTSMPVVSQSPNSTMNPNVTMNPNMTLPDTNATFPSSVNVTAIAEQQAEEAAAELAGLLQRRRTIGVRRRIAVY